MFSHGTMAMAVDAVGWTAAVVIAKASRRAMDGAWPSEPSAVKSWLPASRRDPASDQGEVEHGHPPPLIQVGDDIRVEIEQADLGRPRPDARNEHVEPAGAGQGVLADTLPSMMFAPNLNDAVT